MIEVLILKTIDMLKKILKLEGAKELSAKEQKTIIGGDAPICPEGSFAKRCNEFGTVPYYWECVANGTKFC